MTLLVMLIIAYLLWSSGHKTAAKVLIGVVVVLGVCTIIFTVAVLGFTWHALEMCDWQTTCTLYTINIGG